MSTSSVETVREILAEWNRGDVDALLARVTEDFEWHPVLVASVEGRVYRGADGFREFLEEWTNTWETWNLEAEEMREIGAQVLVLTRVQAKGRGSGLEMNEPLAHLFEFSDGLLCRAQTFLDRSEAMATAAGREKEAA